MPEGDTIAQSAATLAGVLVGRAVTRFRSPVPGVEERAGALGVVGSRIAAVEARGKHLLIHFGTEGHPSPPDHQPTMGPLDPPGLSRARERGSPIDTAVKAAGGAVLRTHMRMTGAWHLYRAGTRWQKPATLARVILEAGDVVAVCFSAPEVELLAPEQLAGHAGLTRLGPDLLAPDFDEAAALARLRTAGDLEVADALLDQSIAAGIGNVYKSEVLFLERVSPFVRVGTLPDETLRRLLQTARRQLRRNVGTGRRRTTPGGQQSALWVYERAGKPCARCGTSIRRVLQGPHARSTYWCATCQPDSLPAGWNGRCADR